MIVFLGTMCCFSGSQADIQHCTSGYILCGNANSGLSSQAGCYPSGTNCCTTSHASYDPRCQLKICVNYDKVNCPAECTCRSDYTYTADKLYGAKCVDSSWPGGGTSCTYRCLDGYFDNYQGLPVVGGSNIPECEQCPVNSSFMDGECYCPTGYWHDKSSNVCAKCPSYATCDDGQTFKCKIGYYKDGKSCLRCPYSSEYKGYGTSDVGSTTITSCYLPSGGTFSDVSGNGSFVGKCWYKK